MEVSVIIPTYNRRDRVDAAIASVLAQSFQDFELIVVDDGSDDGTDALLETWAGRIKVLQQPNRGVSAARNRGLMAATGRLVAFLDSDDLWLPHKLQRQVEFLAAHPHIKIMQTQERWLRNGRPLQPKSHHRKRSGWIFPDMLKLCLISPSAVIVERRLFDRVGLFDESLPACEDYDMWLRIGACYEIGLLDQTLVVKQGGHADQLSTSIWGLDRFRIRSLCKIRDTVVLPDDWRRALDETLLDKCRIMAQGAEKRGKGEAAAHYRELIATVTQDALASLEE